VSSTPVPVNQWTHVAAVGYQGTISVYINGAQSGTTSTSVLSDSLTPSLVVGDLYASYNHDWAFSGYIDEFRFTNGIARWTGNFTPPTSPYGVYPPASDFSASAVTGTTPLTVQFNNLSLGTITSWSWDFGDGQTSAAQQPAHMYATAGTFTVGLTGSGPEGTSTNTKNDYITVRDAAPGGIDEYTKLMLHFNGPDGSRTFTDSEDTPKSVTGYGTARISTDHGKFGGASLLLDGNNSYLRVPSSPDWNFSGYFTIDFWWYPTSGGPSPIIDTGSGVASLVIEELDGTVSLWISSNGTDWNVARQANMGTPSGAGFDHFALVHIGNTYYTFQNGVLTNSIQSPFSPYYSTSNSLTIGHDYDGYARGYLDELRILKGDARWTSDFTPPGFQYTEGAVAPTAGFSFSPNGGPAPLPVEFTDTSTGSVASWSWDFGDGSTSTSQHPGHVYLTPGTYTVTLTASGTGGSNPNTQTGSITVSAPPTGGIDDYTKLMLHFDGPDGSTTFTDSEDIPKSVVGYGNARISTAYGKFGGSSLFLDGNASALRVPADPDWNFSGDFTIDFWWYHTSSGVASPIIGASGLLIEDLNGTVSFWISSNGSDWDVARQVSMGTPSGTGFDHFALVRAGNAYYTFQNGLMINSITDTRSPYYDASIGLTFGQGYDGFAVGYLDEFRISKGIVRWLANFTPPGSEYTAPTTGSLTVTISPAGFSADAKWSLDGGGTWFNGGYTAPNIPPGSHTVTFSTVSCWNTPISQQVTIVKGHTATAAGTYVQPGYAVTTSTSGGGSMNRSSANPVACGNTVSFTLFPDSTHHIDSVSGCGGSRFDNTYTTGPITQDCTVTATFAAGAGSVTVTIDPSGLAGAQFRVDGGAWHNSGDTVNNLAPGVYHTVSYSTVQCWTTPDNWHPFTFNGETIPVTGTYTQPRYNVWANVEGSGTITPSYSQNVACGTVLSYTLQPNQYYYISSANGCGGSRTGNTYTTAPISQDCEVTAEFYSNYGSLTVSLPYYAGAQWRLDGGDWHNPGDTVHNIPHGYHTVSYSTIPCFITPADTVVVIYGTQTASVAQNYVLQTHTVTGSVSGGGGTISSPTQPVYCGSTASLLVTPSAGEAVSSISGCGGNAQPVVGAAGPVSYQTGPITGDCAVTVAFSTYPGQDIVRVSGGESTYYTSLQAAYDDASDGDVIKYGGIGPFTDNLAANRDVSVTIDGGYGLNFSPGWSCDVTQILGQVVISNGHVRLRNFRIKKNQ